MLSPVTFVQINGMRICIDVWDVCNIVEKQGSTEITYMPTEKSDIFVTGANFDEVLELLEVARNREPPHKHRDGDAWKNGGYDDDHED